MKDVNVLKRLILQKLIRANLWGGKHTPLHFIKKGIPEHYRNTPRGKRDVEKALGELAKEGWVIILSKRTGKGYDDHISLSSKKVSEIKQFLEKIK